MGHSFWGRWGGCCGGRLWNLTGMGFLGPLLGLLFSILLIIGIAWLVIWLIRRTADQGARGSGSSGPSSELTAAQEILKQRYAQGEISREEYREILRDLK